MKTHLTRYLFQKIVFSAACLAVISCTQTESKPKEADNPVLPKSFSEYWYQGKAEISRFELQQARYGEMRSGEAVLVYVTEDFLTSQQVKLEDYSKGKTGATPILKLNLTKMFHTGIYPYTMMASIFSPIDLKNFPHALKVNATVLEWCGQVFTQINNREKYYDVRSFSYFEKEGDDSFSVEKVFLEDEMWTRIRIAPDQLPQGDIRMVPGSLTARLRHRKLSAEPAQATVVTNGDTVRYQLIYPESERKLAIQFGRLFPHEILSWEETYKDGFGEKAKVLTTKAVRKNSIFLDYWNKNAAADSVYRMQLGLTY